MGDPREEMPPGDTRGATHGQPGVGPGLQLPALRFSRTPYRVLRMKRHMLRAIGRGEEHVRMPRRQTAELRMIATLKHSGLTPLFCDCPTRMEHEVGDVKLLMMEIRKTPRLAWLRRGERRRELMLLRVNPDQLERIAADFTRSALGIFKRRIGPDRSDHKMVLG